MMVRKISGIAAVFALLFALAGCSGRESGARMEAATLPAIPQETLETPTQPQPREETVPAPAQETATETVDVDLTKLSSILVFSEVYNILSEPENYIGKTIRMRGEFVAYGIPEENKYSFVVIVADAAACCQQGLEFIWTGHSFPEDYPDLGSEITVTGVFTPFEEDGYTWHHLICDSVEVHS